MLKRLFGEAPKRDEAAIARIKQWVREIAADDSAAREAIAVTVSEIICADPSCPGTETVILIMPPGRKTAAAKVAKPIAEVMEIDAKGAAVVAMRQV
jgi:tetrahydromethanopterin S-methyltransferase subunit A